MVAQVIYFIFFPITLIQCGLLEEIDAQKIKEERREREDNTVAWSKKKKKSVLKILK